MDIKMDIEKACLIADCILKPLSLEISDVMKVIEIGFCNVYCQSHSLWKI